MSNLNVTKTCTLSNRNASMFVLNYQGQYKEEEIFVRNEQPWSNIHTTIELVFTSNQFPFLNI